MFNLFSDIDGYAIAFETAIPKSFLIEGYTSIIVPDGTKTVRVMGNGLSSSYIDTPVNSIEDFNFTSKIPPPPALPLI